MKKSINVFLIGLAAIFTTTAAFAQSTVNTYNNHYLSAETRFNNNTLSLANAEMKSLNLVPANKTAVKAKSAKTSAAGISQVASFLTNTSATSFAQEKKLTDDTFSVSLKQTTSSVGKVAVKEANIVYNEQGIVSIHLNIDKQKGKAFIDANLKKYGHPNNENVLDNFSWIVDGYVLEIQETKTEFAAIYKKATTAVQYLNEGVSVALF